MVESVGKRYKPWLIASVACFVLSLVLLATVVVVSFFYFGSSDAPLWATVLGVLAVLGILAGIGGLMGCMAVAGITSYRADRRARLAPLPEPAGETVDVDGAAPAEQPPGGSEI